MERRPNNETTTQPSLFTQASPPLDQASCAEGISLAEIPQPNAYYIALDRLLDALEELLRGDYPLDDELRRRLSSPTLEMLIFVEMDKSLKLVQEQAMIP
jgi:hypothetical protein